MKQKAAVFCATLLGLAFLTFNTSAQTDGSAKLEATIASYSANGPEHFSAAWVTTGSGTFIKTLWKQGTRYGWTSSQWSSHMTFWNTARAGNTNVDGYTSATATTYTGVNSPVILSWNGRDANNAVVSDGTYKFWVQYAEDNAAQGPWTTNGLQWTKGPAGATNTYPNLGANFTNLKVTWTPQPVVRITSVKAEGNNLVASGTGPANSAYSVLTATAASGATWTPMATNYFDSAGAFRFTNAITPAVPQVFYRLKVL